MSGLFSNQIPGKSSTFTKLEMATDLQLAFAYIFSAISRLRVFVTEMLDDTYF